MYAEEVFCARLVRPETQAVRKKGTGRDSFQFRRFAFQLPNFQLPNFQLLNCQSLNYPPGDFKPTVNGVAGINLMSRNAGAVHYRSCSPVSSRIRSRSLSIFPAPLRGISSMY